MRDGTMVPGKLWRRGAVSYLLMPRTTSLRYLFPAGPSRIILFLLLAAVPVGCHSNVPTRSPFTLGAA